MSQPPPILLPEGLRDRLPPEAEAAQQVTRALLDTMRSHGYRRVAPPIAEFRETMAGDGDDAAGRDLLRFTDPVSRRTLAIRPDITRQVGRIARTRLASAPRPLRLSYAGQVVKLAASALWPEREMLQVGAELIGSDSVAAVCEMAAMAVEALTNAGVADIVVDLTLPDLVGLLAHSIMPLSADTIGPVRDALDAKDAGALRTLGAAAYLPLLHATGPFDEAIARLAAIDAGGALSTRIAALRQFAAALAGHATVTLDPTERHGFEYQSWIGFSIFVPGIASTIGRGGSYAVSSGDGASEPAVGFSLYPDPLIATGLAAATDTSHTLFLPRGHDAGAAAALRADGWVTVAALSDGDDAMALGCSHRLCADGTAIPL